MQVTRLSTARQGIAQQYPERGRNGHHPARPFQTGIGPVSVQIPKVRSKDGTPVTFRSALVPPYVRRTKTLEAALPWLYLKGISSGEMAPALKVLLWHFRKNLNHLPLLEINDFNTLKRLAFSLVHHIPPMSRERQRRGRVLAVRVKGEAL